MKRMSKTIKKSVETDNVYFLKILIYFVLGTIWIKVNGMPVIPVGGIFGVIIAQKDHFAIDRKIEYVFSSSQRFWVSSAGASTWQSNKRAGRI
jgi:hypothetical protein